MSVDTTRRLGEGVSGESGVYDAPSEKGSPERNLLMAMLERAILDYVGNNRSEVSEADEWLFSDEELEAPRPFSFAWLCSELDLEVSKIRRIIKQMPKRGGNRVAPWYFDKDYYARVQAQPEVLRPSKRSKGGLVLVESQAA